MVTMVILALVQADLPVSQAAAALFTKQSPVVGPVKSQVGVVTPAANFNYKSINTKLGESAFIHLFHLFHTFVQKIFSSPLRKSNYNKNSMITSNTNDRFGISTWFICPFISVGSCVQGCRNTSGNIGQVS